MGCCDGGKEVIPVKSRGREEGREYHKGGMEIRREEKERVDRREGRKGMNLSIVCKSRKGVENEGAKKGRENKKVKMKMKLSMLS